MADLNSLIRVRRHVVKQKQKFLTTLYDQADALEEQKQAMLAQLTIEKVKIEEMGTQMRPFFDQYAKAINERISDLDDAADTLNKRIEMAREEVREAFAEVKKIEIIQQRRESEEREKRDKEEAKSLDEIAIEAIQRKKDEY
ncbi:MAG: flagellar FliJ family protein [Alphaproteobacteria bacterium]|nr:flagellar FliJ family protein [Alphaproteobacteria bacterium]